MAELRKEDLWLMADKLRNNMDLFLLLQSGYAHYNPHESLPECQ